LAAPECDNFSPSHIPTWIGGRGRNEHLTSTLGTTDGADILQE